MKTLAMIISTVFILNGFTGNAQMNQGQDQQSGQQQGMMQNMNRDGMCPMYGQVMNQKMHMKKYMMLVNKLPNMQKQLSLTDEQVNQLIDLQTEFRKQHVDHQAQLIKKQMKMEKMLENNASVSEVKKQMQQCAESMVNIKLAAYETAGKMKALLNSEQKEQLQNMMMQQDEMMPRKGSMMNQGSRGMMQKNN